LVSNSEYAVVLESPWKKWLPILQTELDIEMDKAPAVSEVHGNDHIQRVWRRSLRLGKRLGADLEILGAAVYLHDLGRHYVSDNAHGELSAQIAEPVLERMEYPELKRGPALHAIRVHDTTSGRDERNTLESQILYDADKLDTFGVVGVLRYIRRCFGKYPIDLVLKDIDSRWEGITLQETRDLAQPEYEYVKEYFMKLKKEIGE
jgi:HD superfamily phosphodiesterase